MKPDAPPHKTDRPNGAGIPKIPTKRTVTRRTWPQAAQSVPKCAVIRGVHVLKRLVEETADDIRTRRALEHKPVLHGYAETRYGAKSWKEERRVCARIEATTMGLDIRFVVTNLCEGSAEHIYDVLYCARGQAENLIKMHKSQLASDRISCRSPIANQVRLVLHTAAYWLMLTLRDAVPATDRLCKAEFATLRLRLLKLGARVTETASRICMPRGRARPTPRRHLAARRAMKAGAPLPRRAHNLQHQTRATKSHLNRGETDETAHHVPRLLSRKTDRS